MLPYLDSKTALLISDVDLLGWLATFWLPLGRRSPVVVGRSPRAGRASAIWFVSFFSTATGGGRFTASSDFFDASDVPE